jgi:hypothetical protein
MAKKYLCIGQEYESNGEKKMNWQRLGEMFEGKNGKQYVKLYHIPGALIHVFEDNKDAKKEAEPDIAF